MAVACGSAAVHKIYVFYCVIVMAQKHKVMLVIWFLRRALEITPMLALCIGNLFSGFSAIASQGHRSTLSQGD